MVFDVYLMALVATPVLSITAVAALDWIESIGDRFRASRSSR